jgi:hypothetical protein
MWLSSELRPEARGLSRETFRPTAVSWGGCPSANPLVERAEWGVVV